jgi:hypothetical protein
MKKLLLAAAFLISLPLANAVKADTIEDPLHGCTTSGCTEATIGGNAVTPIASVTNFGFFASPAQSGDLVLKFLIPDNIALSTVQSFVAGTTVTGTSSSSLSLFSTTPWTSGNLESDYLGITSFANGSPPNPLSAWLGATQTLQPTATGYFVALADVGNYSLPTPGGVLPDVFSLAPATYFAGGLIVGNLFTGENHTLDVTTAQSGALFFTGSPVPAPLVGAGVPGLIAGCLGMVALARRRMTRFRIAA